MNKQFGFLKEVINCDSDFLSLLSAVNAGKLPAVCTGLGGIYKAVNIAVLSEEVKTPITVITSGEAEAYALYNDLVSLGVDALYYPLRDLSLAGIYGESREYEHKRIHTLSAVAGGDFRVLIMSVDAATEPTIPKEKLISGTFTLSVGKEFDLNDLTERLIDGRAHV